MSIRRRACECVALLIVAVCTKEPAVTSDQEAYHSCFQDLISRARAKLPLGSQFSFFLIGALIKSEKHIVFAHLKLDTVEASYECRCVSACNMKDKRKNN